MSGEEPKKYIIKIVLKDLQSIVSIIGEIISIQEGDIRSLYLSPRGLNGVREMIIEYEGKASSVDLLVKTMTQVKGCVKAVITEFPAVLIQTDEGVYR